MTGSCSDQRARSKILLQDRGQHASWGIGIEQNSTVFFLFPILAYIILSGFLWFLEIKFFCSWAVKGTLLQAQNVPKDNPPPQSDKWPCLLNDNWDWQVWGRIVHCSQHILFPFLLPPAADQGDINKVLQYGGNAFEDEEEPATN